MSIEFCVQGGAADDVHGSVTGSCETHRPIGRVRSPERYIGVSEAASLDNRRHSGLAFLRVQDRATVIAEPHRGLEEHGSWSFAASSVRFSETYGLMVGDRSTFNATTCYRLQTVEVDADDLRRALAGRCEAAFDRLLADPDSDAVVRALQQRLAPPADEPQVEHNAVVRRVTTAADVDVGDCTILVVGHRNTTAIDSDFTAPHGQLPITTLLRSDAALVKAMAHHLRDPTDQTRKGAFEAAVRKAVTPEVLGTVLDTADFTGTSVSVTHGWRSMQVDRPLGAMVGSANQVRSTITICASTTIAPDIADLALPIETAFLPPVDTFDTHPEPTETRGISALRRPDFSSPAAMETRPTPPPTPVTLPAA